MMDPALAEAARTLGGLAGLVFSVPALPLHPQRRPRIAQLVLGAASALFLFTRWVVAMP